MSLQIAIFEARKDGGCGSPARDRLHGGAIPCRLACDGPVWNPLSRVIPAGLCPRSQAGCHNDGQAPLRGRPSLHGRAHGARRTFPLFSRRSEETRKVIQEAGWRARTPSDEGHASRRRYVSVSTCRERGQLGLALCRVFQGREGILMDTGPSRASPTGGPQRVRLMRRSRVDGDVCASAYSALHGVASSQRKTSRRSRRCCSALRSQGCSQVFARALAQESSGTAWSTELARKSEKPTPGLEPGTPSP